jgi:hypothetical protein
LPVGRFAHGTLRKRRATRRRLVELFKMLILLDISKLDRKRKTARRMQNSPGGRFYRKGLPEGR